MMKVSSASPTVATPGTAIHSGYLNKLSGRAFLYPGSWKKKYCVLDSQRLFVFDSKEDEAACVANPERISSYINLEYYDACEEAAAKEVRKASNVFVVSSSDKSFFESGRYYFSAETLPEMNEWINKIRLVMESLRKKGSSLVKQTAKKTMANQPAVAVTNKETKKDNPSIKEEDTLPAFEDYPPTNLEEVVSKAEHLDCITRQRAKGPAGRRLPRQRFPLVDDSPSLNGREQRSGSLSLLDSQEAEQNRAPVLHNRSFDVSAIGEEAYWSLPPPGASFKPVYAYSSSDESLNASFSSAVTENEKKANNDKKPNEKSVAERPILTGKRNCKAAAKPAPLTELEAVETLAEEPRLHSSTPSLPLVQKPQTNWLSIGSSSTAPSVVRQKHRAPARSVVTLAQMEATWTRQGNGGDAGNLPDDAPTDSLGEQLRGALEQIHGLRAMIALLESDSSSARRDMGSLQENLTTVQSAATSAAEKVARMQTQVNNIERQVSSAVKEAQNVQQKANDALAAATAAERDFRSLEDQCRTLLAELRKQQQVKNQNSKAADEEIPDTLDETRPPLTPNFSIGSLVSSTSVPTGPNSKAALAENDQARPLPLSSGFLSLQPPTSFDFASILSAKCNSASLEAPKIKSALKSDGKASAKSISFGPTTTFQDPSSPLFAPDVSNPFATSTLRKVAPKIQTSDN